MYKNSGIKLASFSVLEYESNYTNYAEHNKNILLKFFGKSLS